MHLNYFSSEKNNTGTSIPKSPKHTNNIDSEEDEVLSIVKKAVEKSIMRNKLTIEQLKEQSEFISEQLKILQRVFILGVVEEANKVFSGGNIELNQQKQGISTIDKTMTNSQLIKGSYHHSQGTQPYCYENQQNERKLVAVKQKNSYFQQIKPNNLSVSAVNASKTKNSQDPKKNQQSIKRDNSKVLQNDLSKLLHNQTRAISEKQQELIYQFFQTEFPAIIKIDGNRKSLIFKKELVAAYLLWRLEIFPEETDVSIVSVQRSITHYVKTHMYTTCHGLRHQFSGMRFRSLDYVKRLLKEDFSGFYPEDKKGQMYLCREPNLRKVKEEDGYRSSKFQRGQQRFERTAMRKNQIMGQVNEKVLKGSDSAQSWQDESFECDFKDTIKENRILQEDQDEHQSIVDQS